MPRVAAAIVPPHVLSINLLGDVWAAWDDRPVRPTSRGALSLLVVLASQRWPRRREQIAADVWPDGGRRTGAWLRQALWQLRRAFAAVGAPDTVVAATAERLGLDGRLSLDLDVARFRTLLTSRPPALEDALSLYRGEFAEGIGLECFARERERLSDLYEDALAQLARRRLRDGDIAGAREAAMGLVDRDPLREEAHAMLIEIHGRDGSRDQVVRQYRRLQRLLDRELGVEPLAETQESFRIAMGRTADRSAQTVARRKLRGRPDGPVRLGKPTPV
jgi:DNA-binding SARP family transcriptional activator